MTLLFLPSIALAQSGSIRGVVIEEGIGEPLPGVNIYLDGTTKGDATGVDGVFVITEVAAGSYVLVVRALGYETVRQDVQVVAGQQINVTLTIVERPIEIGEIVVERVMMTGGRRGLGEIPGSAHYIGPRELETFSSSDVNRVLRSVPGVYLQEEDGYGQRPNIGLRGTGVERSSKITVMEDGVLAAPAPYAAPAAYYFPTMGRMQGVEVRKGSSQIKYGPYTTGGALNLISTQIPYEFAGYAEVLVGQDEARTLHAHAGHSLKNVGFLVETYQNTSDGFKELDGGGETGFDKKDYLAKLRFNTSPNAKTYQAFTLKIGSTDETSDETYLGLTEADFEKTPFRRYAGSQQDVMETEHRLYQARHFIRPTSFLDVTTTLYRTEFARNWYKLDRVRASEDGSRVSISDVLAEPEAFAAEYAILTGTTSPNDNALEVKANNRSYYARGVESIVGFQFDARGMEHDVELGVRLHEDQIDRFQWVDFYEMSNGLMNRTQAGTPGTESNRVETAQALASFVQYRLSAGKLLVTPGLRFEHITIEREDYGKEDPERTGADLALRSNEVDVWIPGVGMDYQFTQTLSSFAGIHKGFAPPGSQEGSESEESVNYELGVRYQRQGLQVQAVGFFNNYSNLLGADFVAAGGQGTTDQFNGGDVDVRGLELSLDYNLGVVMRTRWSVPLALAYTFTDAAFQTSFESEFGGWGNVQEGDTPPYLPKHQLAARLGVEKNRFGVNLSASYVGRMRTTAGQGIFDSSETIDSHFVLDLAADVQVTRDASVFATLRNLTDEVYVVARRPAGLRPGLPRLFLIGLKTRF